MMKLFLVASLIAFTAALKDSPRRRKSTSQNTKRALHGKGKSSKYGYTGTGLVTTDEVEDLVIPAYASDAVESTYEAKSFGGPNVDLENPVDNTKAILKLVQSGVVSTNADDTVLQSSTALNGPTQATPTGDLSQTSISTTPTSPAQAAPNGDLSQTSTSTTPTSPAQATPTDDLSQTSASTDPTSPAQATPTDDLSQTSTSTDPTSPAQTTPTNDLSQTSIDASSPDTEEDSSDALSSDVPAPAPALAPSTTLPREVNPTAFSSDSPSLVPSSVPSSATLPTGATPTAFSSDEPSLLPSLVPSSLPKEDTPTAFSSDAPSLVPSTAPESATSQEDSTPTAFSNAIEVAGGASSSDPPSFVPSMAPSSAALPREATPTAARLGSDAPSLVPSLVPSLAEAPGDATSTAFSSDAPSLVPSTTPSSATVPTVASPTAFSSDTPSLVPSSEPILITAGEASPTEISDGGSTSAPSAITSDSPSATPSDNPSMVPTNFSVDPNAVSVLDPSGFATCEEYNSPAFDDSITAEIAVQYWYNLEVEDEINTFNVAISELVETVEIVLLETVQATMCADSTDRRRLATNSIAFSASPRDLRMGSCGDDCYPVYGAMTVKVDQSVSQDPDARDAMYCSVLQIIHGTMGTSTLSDLTGVRSTELLDRAVDKCDLGDGFGLQGSGVTKGPPISGNSSGGGEDGGIPLGVTMSYVVAGGLITFTAMFMYGRRKQHRRDANGNSGSMMDMDTTIVGDGAASIDIVPRRTGIDPPPSQGSPYSNSSLYTGSHADNELLLENSGECWSDVDLEPSNASELGLPAYEHA